MKSGNIILCGLYCWAWLAISNTTQAQQELKGKVLGAPSEAPLRSVTIVNVTRHLHQLSDEQGNFWIGAATGDSIVFSMIGYLTMSLVIDSGQLGEPVTIRLFVDREDLAPVIVSSGDYAADSMRRRLEYKQVYQQHLHTIMGGNTPANGFGVNVSPITYFSKNERTKRRQLRQLAKNEEEYYIDFYFSRDFVKRVTGLAGEPLQYFMRTYRPSYAFMRGATHEDVILYVNDCLKKMKAAKP